MLCKLQILGVMSVNRTSYGWLLWKGFRAGSDWPTVKVHLAWLLLCMRGKGGDAINCTPFLFRGRGCTFLDTHKLTHWHLWKNACAWEQIRLCAPCIQTHSATHRAHLNACTRLFYSNTLILWVTLFYFVSLPLLEGHSDSPPCKKRHTISTDSRGSPSEAALPVASVH